MSSAANRPPRTIVTDDYAHAVEAYPASARLHPVLLLGDAREIPN